MKTYNIEANTTSVQLTEEDLNDILCTCFEGGCGYWACLDNATFEWEIARKTLIHNGNEMPTLEDVMVQMLNNGDNIFIEDEEDDCERYSFDLDDFLSAIKSVIEDGYWDGEDICDIDGEIGDMIIQYAVFGEVVYG